MTFLGKNHDKLINKNRPRLPEPVYRAVYKWAFAAICDYENIVENSHPFPLGQIYRHIPQTGKPPSCSICLK